MGLPNPTLLTSSGATFQISPLPTGLSVPTFFSATVGTAAVVGDTSLAVTITAPSGVTGKSIANGTYALAGTGNAATVVVVDADTSQTATSLPVEPLKKAVASGTVIKFYLDALPVIGLEGANLQLQKEVNQVVLLASKGWQTRAYSTGSFQFSGSLHIPVSAALAASAQRIYASLLGENYVYVERFASNGDYVAGIALVTDASDTFQGAQYVTVNTTFQGSGVPIKTSIPA